jgi:hypothetical protein
VNLGEKKWVANNFFVGAQNVLLRPRQAAHELGLLAWR